MSNEDAHAPKTAASPETGTAAAGPAAAGKRPAGRRIALAGAAAALVALGGGIGAGAYSFAKPAVQMAPLTPVAINAMPDDSIVTLKGTVAEVFGNKFIIADTSGRALVETGRAGEGGKLVSPNEAVTVQGRFDDGFVKAAFLVRADGRTEAIGGLGPKGPGHRKHGPRHAGDAPRGTEDIAPDGPERGPGPR